MTSQRRFILATAAVSFAVSVSAARAQDTPIDEAGTAPQFTVGIGAAYVPRHEGADDSRVRALPLLNFRYGRFFAGALGGVGYDFSTINDFSFGPLLLYRFGRDEDDAARLRGLGDVDGGLDAGAFFRWRLRPFTLHASVRRGVTGDDRGTQVRVGAAHTLALAPSDSVTLDLSADWADNTVMQAYFGVTPSQSLRSGLPAYAAESGLRRYGASLIWNHSFSKEWFTSVGGTAYRLGGDAADSPIVERRTVPALSFAVGYRF